MLLLLTAKPNRFRRKSIDKN